jgi:hypothetical protein
MSAIFVMKHPKDFLPTHPQVHGGSCPAWGLEAIVKTYEAPLKSSFQDRCKDGCDWGDVFLKELRHTYGINASRKGFREGGMGAFKRAALPEIAKGLYPAVTVPSFVAFDLPSQQMRIACHAYIVTENRGNLEFYTRRVGDQAVYVISEPTMAQAHYSWKKCIGLHDAMPDLILNALFHQPIEKRGHSQRA